MLSCISGRSCDLSAQKLMAQLTLITSSWLSHRGLWFLSCLPVLRIFKPLCNPPLPQPNLSCFFLLNHIKSYVAWCLPCSVLRSCCCCTWALRSQNRAIVVNINYCRHASICVVFGSIELSYSPTSSFTLLVKEEVDILFSIGPCSQSRSIWGHIKAEEVHCLGLLANLATCYTYLFRP